MDSIPPEELLVHTLGLLEWRLRRIEFVLNGGLSEKEQPAKEPNVLSRIKRLEQSLHQLASKSDTVRDLLNLQSRFPQLLAPELPRDPSEPSLDEKLSMVVAEAPNYSTVSSQLRSLEDVSLPPTESFSRIVALQPRIAELGHGQYEQAMEISGLRKRSGMLVMRWHEVFILGQGRCWAEWDSKLRDMEREVRREEVRHEQD